MSRFFRPKEPAEEKIQEFAAGIIPLWEPSEQDHHVDVIFIHGLTGDRKATWTHAEDAEPWPGILLPKHLKDARILSYGYDAYPIPPHGPASQTNLRTQAEALIDAVTSHRSSTNTSHIPIIFVAHSLGGLVCKAAMVAARLGHYHRARDFLEKTAAIMFMGTPHKGSWMAYWATLSMKGLGFVKRGNYSLLEALQTDTETLGTLHKQFIQTMAAELLNSRHKIELFSFFETLPYNGTIVVKNDSACIEEAENIQTRKNHSELTKFRNTIGEGEDPTFDSFLQRLNQVLQEIRHPSSELDAKNRQECLNSLVFPKMGEWSSKIGMPESGTCRWIYETDEYKRWIRAIDQTDRLLLIKGIPGSGKTTLMKDLLRSVRTSWDGLCLDFFVNRDCELEKTEAGLWRALLSQLVGSSTSAVDFILPMFQKELRFCHGKGATWNAPQLWELLHKTMASRVFKGTSLAIFIDGLDKFGADLSQEIADKMQELSSVSVDAGVSLHICMSCRSHPFLSLNNCLEIRHEKHNLCDIEVYVKRRIRQLSLPARLEVNSQPTDLEARTQNNLQNKVIAKAAGSFLWTTHVVHRLRRLHRQGWDLPDLEPVLNHIPQEMEELYADTVEKMQFEQHFISALIAQWVYAARRSLSPAELRFALALSVSVQMSESKSLQELEQSPRIPPYTPEGFGKFLIYSTCGMLHIVERGIEYTVEPVHDSIIKFFTSDQGLRLFNFTSKTHFINSSKDLICKVLETYSAAQDFQDMFDLESDYGLDIVKYCSDGSERRTKRAETSDTPLGLYICQYGLGHIEEASSFCSCLQETGMSSPIRARLQRILRAWVCTMCRVTESFEEQGVYDHILWKNDRNFDFIAKHATLLGISNTELEEFIACINNRNIFLRDLATDRSDGYNIQLVPGCTYIQIFWTASSQDSADEAIELARSQKALRTLDAAELIEKCNSSSSGIAFVAFFSLEERTSPLLFQNNNIEISHQWPPRAKISDGPRFVPKLSTWEITSDLPRIRELGLLAAGSPFSPNRTAFHQAPDHGYISLLMYQSEDSGYICTQQLLSIRYREESSIWRLHSNQMPGHRRLSPTPSISSFDSLRVNWGVPVDTRLRLDEAVEGKGEENANIQKPSGAEILSIMAPATPAGLDSDPSVSIPNLPHVVEMPDPYSTKMGRDDSPAQRPEANATSSPIINEHNVGQRRFSTAGSNTYKENLAAVIKELGYQWDGELSELAIDDPTALERIPVLGRNNVDDLDNIDVMDDAESWSSKRSKNVSVYEPDSEFSKMLRKLNAMNEGQVSFNAETGSIESWRRLAEEPPKAPRPFHLACYFNDEGKLVFVDERLTSNDRAIERVSLGSSMTGNNQTNTNTVSPAPSPPIPASAAPTASKPL